MKETTQFENLDFACVDHDRRSRQGVGEVIFCPGKTAEQIASIAGCLLQKESFVMATRADKEQFEAVSKLIDCTYFETARIIRFGQASYKTINFKASILTAGTSDIPVAEEAAVFLEHYGVSICRVYDVGVAGIHRLLSRLDEFKDSDGLIVVAGMDGALPSVVGGLVSCPVVAVPTSTGYGTAFGGITPLMTMLNSCASGVTVVNIDNGFGAAMALLRCSLKNYLPRPATGGCSGY